MAQLVRAGVPGSGPSSALPATLLDQGMRTMPYKLQETWKGLEYGNKEPVQLGLPERPVIVTLEPEGSL